MEIKEKVEEIKKEVNQRKLKVRNTFSRKLPFLLIFLISFVLTGVMEICRPDFNPSIFKSSDYWFNLILTNTSCILMSIGACLMSADTIRMKDESGEIQALNESLNNMSPTLQKSDVDLFIYETNKGRKTQAWLIKQNAKLLKLENRAKEQDTYNFVKYQDTKENKYKTRYVKKKLKVLNKISTEYIEKNIEYIKVKYTKITRKLITNGSYMNNQNDDIPNKSVNVLMGGILPKFIFTSAFTTFILSFRVDFEKFQLIGILFVLIKCIGLICNYIYGRDFAPQYVKDTTIDLLYIRIHWVTLYTEWKKRLDKKE